MKMRFASACAARSSGENMRGITWCLIEEVESGDWGIAGKALTTDDARALAAGKAG